MGQIFSSKVQELREELERTEQALQKHLESAAHELDAEQRRRKAAEAEVAAAAAAADALRAEIAAARDDEATALETAAAARKAHDEHALLVKRILTAQHKYGVGVAWPGVPSGAAAGGEAEQLAVAPSARALARAEVAAARLADVGGGAVRTALAEAEDDALAALLWPRPLGDVSVAVRTGRSCAQLGLVLTPGPGLGGPTSGAAGPSAIDTARVAAGVFHRLPSAAVALGASAVYCPTTKGFDEANCALLVGRGASAGGAARTAALVSAAGGSSIAFSHALASIDHTGELSLGARWLLGGNCRLDARTSVDVNSKRVCKAGAHLTFSL